MGRIVVNTDLLNDCANRLASASARVENIAGRFRELFSNSKLPPLMDLLYDNSLITGSQKLNACQIYLRNTASNFEHAEQAVIMSLRKIESTKMINDIMGIATSVLSGRYPYMTDTTGFPPHTTIKHSAEMLENAIASNEKNKEDEKTLGEQLKWLKSGWIDDTFKDSPLWMRESLKEAVKDVYKEAFGSDLVAAYDITQKIIDGDPVEGVKKFLNQVLKKEGDKGFFSGLDLSFYINSVCNGLEAYNDFKQNPSLTALGKVGWESTIGSVFETVGNKAWDFVKYIPYISDYYEKNGATDYENAFNVAYTEWTRTIFGDGVADYVESYYADNGGLYQGLVNGGNQLVNEIKEASERHGGFIGLWLSGWNSIF